MKRFLAPLLAAVVAASIAVAAQSAAPTIAVEAVNALTLPDDIYLGEVESWRVQKFILRAPESRTSAR